MSRADGVPFSFFLHVWQAHFDDCQKRYRCAASMLRVDAMKGLLGDLSQDKSTGKQQVDTSGRPRNLVRLLCLSCLPRDLNAHDMCNVKYC